LEERDPLIGQTLNGQFEIVDRLGAGGMGAVYRARQLSVDREVAIKILRTELATNNAALTRFENESKIVARLRHPNTLRLYDCQRTEDHRLFIVTELLHGSPLSVVMRTERSSLERILKILEQVCGSLAEAHQAGIIHRDIKPENVFLERVGTDEMVKLLDFGIAKLVGSDSLTGSGVIGTAYYMAPEQASGAQVDRRTDIYALGVMTYQLVTGRLPFTGDSPIAVLYKHVHDAPPPLDPSTPPLLVELISDMLAKDPRNRPASVDEVRHRLSEVGATSRGFMVSAPGAVLSEDALVAPTHLSGPTRMLPPRKRYGWLIGVAALLIGAFGAAFALRETAPPQVVTLPLPPPPPPPPPPTVVGVPKSIELDPSREKTAPVVPKKRPPIKKPQKKDVAHDKPVDVSWD
jgi:eukaryotic-like serine/threonine-protein kinase